MVNGALMTRLTALGLTAVAVLALLVGCAQPTTPSTAELHVGSSSSPAMRVMAEIYAGALRNTGTEVAREVIVGDDPELLDAMQKTDVDLFPAFTGQLLSVLTPETTAVTAEAVYNDVNRALPQGVSVGDATPVLASPQVVVATRVAEPAQVTGLADCGRLPAGLTVLTVGAPDTAVLRSFADAGCRFGAVQALPDASAVVDRVATGAAVGVLTPLELSGDRRGSATSVQALRVSTPEDGDGQVSAVVAAGPRAQTLVPVYRGAALSRDDVKTINKVAGEITTADLAAMAASVARGSDPHEIAVTWLGDHGL